MNEKYIGNALLKMANAKQNYDAFADEIDELRAEKEELLPFCLLLIGRALKAS